MGALAREALLNTVRRGSALWAVAVLAVLTGSGAAVFASAQQQEFVDLLADQHARGRGVIVISSASAEQEAAIDRSSCEVLTKRPDVRRSGLLVQSRRMDLPTLGADIQVVGVSLGLHPALVEHEAVVGPALGGEPGTVRLLLDGRAVDGIVAGGGVPTSGMDSAVAVGLAPDVVTGPYCLVELVDRARVGDVAPELVAALRSNSHELVAGPALRESIDVLDMHARRVERFIPVVLGVFGAACTLLVNWLRSSAFAAYRLSGTRRGELLLLVMLEQVVAAGLYATSGVLAVLVLGGPPAAGPWLLIGAFVWVASAPVSWLAAGRNPFRMAKDR